MQIIPETGRLRIKFAPKDRPKGSESVEEMVFPYSLYVRLKKKEYQDTFDETNAWLNSLDDFTRQRIVRFYMNCHTHFNTTTHMSPLVRQISKEVKNIEDILNFQSVVEWNEKVGMFARTHLEEIHLIKEEELASTTYNDQEAYALECFGVAIKVLTPIFGSLADAVRSETSNSWKEMKVLSILNGTEIAKSPPYLKLKGFCSGKADSARNKISSTAVRGITPQKLQEGTLAVGVVKLMATYNIKMPKNAVQLLFQETKTYIDTTCTHGFHDKGESASASANSDDGDGVVQHWRRAQDTTAADRATTARYIKNIDFMIRDMGLSTPKKEIEALASNIIANPNPMKILHIVLMARAFIKNNKPLISLPILAVITDVEAVRIAQACAITRFREEGWHGLAAILGSHYRPKEIGNMTEANVSIEPFTDKELQDMTAKYPQNNPPANARNIPATTEAYKFCDKIEKFVNAHSINTDVDLSQIRHEFADMTITL